MPDASFRFFPFCPRLRSNVILSQSLSQLRACQTELVGSSHVLSVLVEGPRWVLVSSQIFLVETVAHFSPATRNLVPFVIGNFLIKSFIRVMGYLHCEMPRRPATTILDTCAIFVGDSCDDSSPYRLSIDAFPKATSI